MTKKEKNTYQSNLKNLTNNILKKYNEIINNELEKFHKLESKIQTIKNSKISEIQKIFFLIDDCKKYGTLPFSGIARIAFISTKSLK